MFEVRGTVEFFDTATHRSVGVALKGTGRSVEDAMEMALSNGHWRDGIARPAQAALDTAAGREVAR